MGSKEKQISIHHCYLAKTTSFCDISRKINLKECKLKRKKKKILLSNEDQKKWKLVYALTTFFRTFN